MEQELSYLSAKLQHPNLIHYHSMSIEEKNDTLCVRVCFTSHIQCLAKGFLFWGGRGAKSVALEFTDTVKYLFIITLSSLISAL